MHLYGVSNSRADVKRVITTQDSRMRGLVFPRLTELLWILVKMEVHLLHDMLKKKRSKMNWMLATEHLKHEVSEA